jgi:hypothetical protein
LSASQSRWKTPAHPKESYNEQTLKGNRTLMTADS